MFTRQDLTKALKLNFGFDKFKGNQEEIILSLLNGRDTFVLMLPVAVTYDAWDCHSDFPSHCIDEKSGRCHAPFQP